MELCPVTIRASVYKVPGMSGGPGRSSGGPHLVVLAAPCAGGDRGLPAAPHQPLHQGDGLREGLGLRDHLRFRLGDHPLLFWRNTEKETR